MNEAIVFKRENKNNWNIIIVHINERNQQRSRWIEKKQTNTKVKLQGLIIGKRCKSMHSRTTHTHS